MAQYECTGCGLVETLNFEPEACSVCGNGHMIDKVARAKAERDATLIAEQNDRFRASWGTDPALPGRFVMTPGVDALGSVALARVIAAVIGFARFDADNDPWGHHDFGVFEIDHAGEAVRLYWKIDLHDADFLYGSECPTDPDRTRRVLTVLLPSEY